MATSSRRRRRLGHLLTSSSSKEFIIFLMILISEVVPHQVQQETTAVPQSLIQRSFRDDAWIAEDKIEWQPVTIVRTEVPSRPHPAEDILFSAYGRQFHLHTMPNPDVFAPTFSIYRNTVQGSLVVDKDDDSGGGSATNVTLCLPLTGHLKSPSVSPSIVALAQCGRTRDLSGYIRTMDEDFFLEPWKADTDDRRYRLYRKFRQKPKFPRKRTKTRQRRRVASYTQYDGSSSKPRVKAVEVLMALDKHVVSKYGVVEAKKLSVTVFNMAAALFLDSSIGHRVHLVLTGLVLLEHEQPDFSGSHDARHLLHQFCQWQSKLWKSETTKTSVTGNDQSNDVLRGSHRHDHAVLLTAIDFCASKTGPCDTLGYAPIGGMCQRGRSCSISKDSGLSAAYTIAHEIGHNLGMIHDGDDTECSLQGGHLMAPSLKVFDGVASWSECSRRDLDNFLSTEQSRCLDDGPAVHTPKWPSKDASADELPGQRYDAHAQCKLQFGPKSKVCPFNFVKSICQTLWCQSGGRRCESKFIPAAEGTPCGPNEWCRTGECVPHGRLSPAPIHGQWSAWSVWSPCSRTCGGGINRRTRRCDNPKARYGGKYCQGSSMDYRLCNLNPCPSHAPGIRDFQCAAFDTTLFRGHFYTWTSYTQGFTGNSRCKLYCKAKGWGFVATLSERVVDGAPCDGNKEQAGPTDDRCVAGRCLRVGCDGRLNSDLAFDSCGICGGDGSTCRRDIHGGPLQRRDLQFHSLNTKLKPGSGSWSQSCRQGQAHCNRKTCLDQKRCAVRWVTEEWTPCTGCHSTSEGFQKRKVSCNFRWGNDTTTERRVGRRQCEMAIGRRPTRKRTCTCQTRWVVGPWQPCVIQPSTGRREGCGVGSKTRKVECHAKDGRMDVIVPGERCTIKTKASLMVSHNSTSQIPSSKTACQIPCSGNWIALPWSRCSVTCGGGWKVRHLKCMLLSSSAHSASRTYDEQSSASCSGVPRPQTLSRCSEQACPPFKKSQLEYRSVMNIRQ